MNNNKLLYPGALLPIRDWKTPASEISEQQYGRFRIIKREVKAGTAWPMNGTFGYDYCVFTKDATLTLLQEKVAGEWRDWMIDSPYELYAMAEYSVRAEAPNILVGGLGLGLLLHYLTQRRDVSVIKVIERSKDVIQMVAPHFSKDERIEIIQCDFFKVIPRLKRQGQGFNTVIVDIWAGHIHEYIRDFKKARDLLKHYYPEALNLFHPFQKLIDKEIICRHLEAAKTPIRFVPTALHSNTME